MKEACFMETTFHPLCLPHSGMCPLTHIFYHVFPNAPYFLIHSLSFYLSQNMHCSIFIRISRCYLNLEAGFVFSRDFK
jgi:hypothetical protein